MSLISTILFLAVAFYFIQGAACCVYHQSNCTREPRDMKDFLKLTFFPYLIYYKIKGINIKW